MKISRNEKTVKFGCFVEIDKIQGLKERGYDYTELPVEAVMPEKEENMFREVRDYINSFSIKPEVFCKFIPAQLKVVGKNVDWDRVNLFVGRILRRISEVGGRVVVFGSGDARRNPPGFPEDKAHSQLQKFLILASDEASKYNLQIVIEPICRFSKQEGQKGTNTINTVLEALRLATNVNRKNVSVLADLFHMVEEKEPFSNLFEVGESLDHIHVPVPTVNEKEAELKDYQHLRFFSFLQKLRYKQRITIEDNTRRFKHEQFEIDSEKALRVVKTIWNKASP